MDLNDSLLTIDDAENLHLCFELDNNTYALKVKNVLEITALPLLNEPQKLAKYVVGILNYNDMFINVIDIRKVFSLPQKEYELSNKLIVLKGEESLLAIIVDEITNFFTVEQSQTQHVMGDKFGNIVKAFYKTDEKVVNIISIRELEKTVKKSSSYSNDSNYTLLFPQDEESVCVLQKRRNEIAKQPEFSLATDIHGKNQYIIFKISNHLYCIHSLLVRELISLKNYPLTKIPYTPDFVEGIINLKGDFYTVVNLKKFIGIESETPNEIPEPNAEKVIVLETTELKMAFLVDDIADVANIPEDNIETKNDMALDNLYIRAEAYLNDKVYNVLHVEKLINDKRLYIDN